MVHYHIYIDVLFAINLCIDFFLLRLIEKMCKRTATRLRTFLAALFGAVASCLLIILPGISAYLKIFVAYGVISFVMVMIALKSKEFAVIWKGVICLYGLSFLLMGFLDWAFNTLPFLRQKEEMSILIVTIAYVFYCIMKWCLRLWKERKNQELYTVTMKVGDDKIAVKALLDTGNQLFEPISRRPVTIVEKELLNDYIEKGMLKGFCVIPYHSIGKEHGLLHGYELEEILINTEEAEIRKKNIVVAVLDGRTSASNQYQMILHPKLMED